MRDKTITAACLTRDGIEWTTLKLKQDGVEPVEQSFLPFPVPKGTEGAKALASVQLPDEIGERLVGDLTESIRTSELLMRTMEFPTADPVEIASMVGFQIDKISPFPLDQLAVSHETLRQTEKGALVLMVAVKRECIDAIGDTFEQKGLHIHSIDARILGWLHLLEKGRHLSGSGCEILIVDDGIDFALAVLSEGEPIAFRSLSTTTQEKGMVDELANEIGYTLTTLDAEYDLPAPTSIDFWSLDDLPAAMVPALSAKTGLGIRQNNLSTLPPLSEGIIDREIDKKERIELIPREWIEHMKNKQLKKHFMVLSGAMAAVWLCVVLAFIGIYQTRSIALSRVQKAEAALAPRANQAIENRKKLKALKLYADRSTSALECLREVTQLLPAGDIEFGSFKFTKEKGVSLRGTAENDSIVYEFTDALSESKLFAQLKDLRINAKQIKGVRRSEFSLNLMLPEEEENR